MPLELRVSGTKSSQSDDFSPAGLVLSSLAAIGVNSRLNLPEWGSPAGDHHRI
jgi:hypothetical protein